MIKKTVETLMFNEGQAWLKFFLSELVDDTVCIVSNNLAPNVPELREWYDYVMTEEEAMHLSSLGAERKKYFLEQKRKFPSGRIVDNDFISPPF